MSTCSASPAEARSGRYLEGGEQWQSQAGCLGLGLHVEAWLSSSRTLMNMWRGAGARDYRGVGGSGSSAASCGAT